MRICRTLFTVVLAIPAIGIVASPGAETTRLEISGPRLHHPASLTLLGIDNQLGQGLGNVLVLNFIGGKVEQPESSAPRYKVAFWITDRSEPVAEKLRYAVTYVPTVTGGSIYFPGPNDGQDYRLNLGMVRHLNTDGSWRVASPFWSQMVNGAIERTAQ